MTVQLDAISNMDFRGTLTNGKLTGITVVCQRNYFKEN